MSNDFSEFLKLIQPKLSFEESIHPFEPDYSDKYNSRYDLKTNGGIRFINPETGVLFKERDSSINIGFSFMF